MNFGLGEKLIFFLSGWEAGAFLFYKGVQLILVDAAMFFASGRKSDHLG